jgi:serine/threonine-protein kinase HipA
MAAGGRQLVVWFRQHRVGLLSEVGAAWRFDYDEAWRAAAQGFDLSPALPRAVDHIEDGGSQRPVQWFFDNLLPEEEARALLAQEARVSQADAFGLLAFYGAESAGALTLLSPGESPASAGLQPLPDEELSRRIRALPRHSLSHDAPKRMSMAGAQHKLPAVLQGDALFEPTGAAPSTVILKPDHVHVDRYPHSAANEWLCMSLARAVGLPVPDVFLRYVPEPVYGVQRFDREGEWPAVQRRHVLDACQLLSLDRIFKYQQATAETLARLVSLCREKARTRIALLRWSIFNALIGNGDAHLKNLSFFVDARGIALAPHYDLVSTASYAAPGEWGAADLSLTMGRAKRFGELRRDDVFELGQVLGVPPKISAQHLDNLLQNIASVAAAQIDRMEAGESIVRNAGEQRHARVIVRGVLREMRAQLA